MRRINVTPLVEAAGIKFGTDRETVRKQLGDYTEFQKTDFSSNTTDDFGFCHVYYDDENKFEAIEIFDAEVYIGETKVFPIPVEELEELIDDLDDELISIERSIGVYAPDDDEPECILFGVKGYYE